MVEDTEENIHDRLELLYERYRPKGSAIFQQLAIQYQSLTLAQCDNVNDFADKLRKARNEIQQLDKTCTIAEPLFVHQFFSGLGPEYDIFLTSFYQTQSLLPERSREHPENITKAAVTFDEAVMLVEREEQRQNVGTDTAKLALLAKLPLDSEALAQVHVLDSGATNNTFVNKKKFNNPRPYTGEPVIGLGGVEVTPEAIGYNSNGKTRSKQREESQ